MPTDFIERARSLYRTATPGPWSYGEDIKISGELAFRGGSDETGEDVFSCPRHEHARSDPADAEFIAAARTILPAAVEALAVVRNLHPRPRTVSVWSGESVGYIEAEGNCASCGQVWPCDTYKATEVEE